MAEMFETYPFLQERILFHRDIRDGDEFDPVCALRFVAGAKMMNGGHERVCRSMRQRGHELFGVDMPEVTTARQAHFAQPPKRVLIVQRDVTRRIRNMDELAKSLKRNLGRFGMEVEMVLTNTVQTAEEHVRVFSRAGVVITLHGSKSMGQIWMPRHSALIEIIPMAYEDYSFHLLATSCRGWYYEVFSELRPDQTRKQYMDECGDKVPHILNPCLELKSEDVWAPIEEVVITTRKAFERMGHSIGPWLKNFTVS